MAAVAVQAKGATSARIDFAGFLRLAVAKEVTTKVLRNARFALSALLFVLDSVRRNGFLPGRLQESRERHRSDLDTLASGRIDLPPTPERSYCRPCMPGNSARMGYGSSAYSGSWLPEYEGLGVFPCPEQSKGVARQHALPEL
jgi:hypothetical protein